jgi:hypothetical protein
MSGLIYADAIPTTSSSNTASSSSSSSSSINNTGSGLRPANTCIIRQVGNNLVEADDLDTGFYTYATYAVVVGSTPPSPPFSGYFKT